MSRRRLWLIALVALAQVGILLGLAAREEARLADGRIVLLAVRPVDPRDLLRGDYVILTYAVERLEPTIPVAAGLVPGGPAWLVVATAPGEAARPRRVLAEAPPAAALEEAEVALRVVWQGTAEQGGDQRLTLPGIGRYYVPEGTGQDLEEAIRDGAVLARLSVDDDGTARVAALLVGGQPWQAGS